MRQIGILNDESQARLFSQCLYAKGMKNEVETDEPGAWIVWVHDEDRLGEASGLLEQFRRNPTAAEWQEQTKKAAALHKEEHRSQKEFEKRFRKAEEVLPRSRPAGIGVLTLVLIGICGYVAIITSLGKNDAVVRQLLLADPVKYAGSLSELWQGEVWRLISPVIVHFGPMHLIFNMMALFFLGSLIEDRKGSLFLLLMVMVTGVGSNLMQYHATLALARLDLNDPALIHLIKIAPRFGGMSGVIYGLFGFAWMRGKFDPASGLTLSRESIISMMIWFVVCWMGVLGGIANHAHTGGLVIGMAWGFLSAKLRR